MHKTAVSLSPSQCCFSFPLQQSWSNIKTRKFFLSDIFHRSTSNRSERAKHKFCTRCLWALRAARPSFFPSKNVRKKLHTFSHFPLNFRFCPLSLNFFSPCPVAFPRNMFDVPSSRFQLLLACLLACSLAALLGFEYNWKCLVFCVCAREAPIWIIILRRRRFFCRGCQLQLILMATFWTDKFSSPNAL